MDGTTVTLDPSEVEDASKVPTLDASEVVDQSAAAPTIDSTMSMRDRPAQPSGSLKPLMEAPERSPYSDPGSAAFAAQTAGQPMQMGIKSQPQKTVGDVMDNRQEMHFEPVAQRALAQAPKPPVPAGLTAPDPRVAAVRSVPGVGIATTGKVGTDPLAGAVQATKAGAKEFKQGLDLLGPDNFADNSAEGAKQTAAGYTHLVNGLMTMTGPEVTMAVGADPLPFIKGLITGAITGEAAKKVVQAAGGSPEFQEFAKTAGFFLPSMVGALTGATSSKVPFGEGEAKVTDYAAPKGATAPGSGRVSTFSGSNPQEYAAGIRVGGRTMGVRIPRNGTITPQPPPDPAMQMHQAETSSAVQALSDGAAADANAARAAAGIPPPPPPKPPMPAGMDKGELRPAVVSNLAKMVQIAPPGMRAGMFLEAHAQLAGWLGTQRTVVLPDGKLQIIDSPKKAESVAQDILNDEVERHQQAHQDMQDQKADQQKEAQKAAEKQAKDEADQAESSQNEKGEEENPLINRARTLLAANADAPPARQAALLQRQLRVGPGLAQRLLVAARTSQQAPGTGNVVGSSTHPVTEEPREQIERQMASLAGGSVPVVHLPEGTQHRPAVPPGMKMIRVTGDAPGAGMYIYNPAKIQAAAIKEAAKNGTHGDLLGHIAQKEDLGAMKVPAVLQASTADGQPIQESVVDAADPEMVRAQADALRERHPGAHIQARHPDMAMAERDHALAREATGGGDIFDHIAQQRGKEEGHGTVQERETGAVRPHSDRQEAARSQDSEGVRQGEQGAEVAHARAEEEVTQAQGSEGGRGAPEPGEGRPNAAPKPEEIQGWRDAIANAKKLRSSDAAAVNKLIGEIEGKPGTYKAGDKLSDDDRSAVEGNLDTAENPAGPEPADEKQMDPADLERMPPEKIMPAPERKVYGNKVDGQKGGKDLPQIQPAEAKRRIQSWKDEAARIGREEDHSNEVVLSLFDRTGEWSKPYRDAGYDVRQYDIANGDDLMAFFPIADITAINAAGKKIVGVLGAPPCTSFAVSGARWWKDEHDAKNTAMVEKKYGAWAAQYFDTPLEYAKALVAITQAVIEFANPSQFHAVENPIGRFGSANDLPDPLLTFDPANYGDPYTKRTQLWGDFKANLPTANVEASLGSRIHQLRGNVPEQKAARSTTPEGFSYAFFMANHEKPIAVEKPAVADRRVNAAQRQRVSEMSPEEMRRTLLTSDKTGLPNRRAFEDAEHATPAKAIAMSDADGLKALNDKYGYEAGDKLLKAKAEELQAAGVEAYHDKGDEFLYRGDSPADLDRKLEAAREGLRNREIQVTMKDGSVRTFKGADFSYGAGKDANAAESKLKQHKADREAKGERARGELRGIQETGPKEDRGRESTAPKTAIAKGDKGIRFRDDHGVERTGTVLHTNDRITRLRLGSGAENTVKNADVLGARTVPEPGGIGELHSSQMERAPKDFQYKMSNIGEGGVSNLLKGSEWNRDLSGIVSAWRDPANGKVYVVNGHHRHERAEATGGQNLAVRMLEVKNREEARAIGALQNIAEGRGTAIDAAKFIRSSGMTLEHLEQKGISLGEATAQNGVALARLDPSIFEQVATGKLSERKGVAIGRATDNAATQEAIVKMIAKAEARGRHVGEGMVQELARFAASAGEHEQTVESLFGNKVETQNLALEKADVSAYIQKQLRQEKTAFGAVSSEARAKTLSRTGNKIEAKKNALEATAATQALEVYDRLSARRGPVDDALNEAAREIADGKPANNAKQRAYDAIRVAVHEALGSLEGAGARGVQEDSGRGPGAGEEEEKGPSAKDLEDAGQGGIFFTRLHGPVTPRLTPADPLYLKSARVVDAKMRGPMKGADLIKMLENAGIKTDEIKWTGLGELAGEDKVTPDQVREVLAQDRAKLTEIVKGAAKPIEWKTAPNGDRYSDDGYKIERIRGNGMYRVGFQGGESRAVPTEDEAHHIVAMWRHAAGDDHSATRYGSYQLPGGENYREMLLTLPDVNVAAIRKEQRWQESMQEELDRLVAARDAAESEDEKAKHQQAIYDLSDTWNASHDRIYDLQNRAPKPFTSGHWDEPNILTHIRYNDRISADGKKLLHVEEVQSDWHQKGRKHGYGDPEALEAARTEHDRAQEEYQRADRAHMEATDALNRFSGNDVTPEWTEASDRYGLAREAAKQALTVEQAARRKVNGLINAVKIPDAPFKKTWHELALRRMLHHAAENGYDGMSWTPGEQQVERYALESHISELNVFSRHDGSGFDLSAKLKDGGQRDIASGVKRDKLADYVGKEMAQRISDDDVQNKTGQQTAGWGYQGAGEWKTYRGLDLKVGGSGMKGFYDQIVPAYLNKLGKQWGAKVGETAAVHDITAMDPTGERAEAISTRLREIARRLEQIKELPAEHFGAEEQRLWDEQSSLIREKRALPKPTSQASQPVPYLPITDAMRKSVTEEGQPMFSPAKLDATPEQRAKAQRLTTSDPKFHYLDGPGVAKLYQKNLRGVVLEGETPALPGLEHHVEEHQKSAEEVSAEALKQAGAKDISGAAGRMERDSPLFRDSGASEQGALFTKPKPPQRGTGQGAINFDVPEGFKELSPEKRMIYFHKAARANNFSLGYNLIHGRLTVHPPTVEGGPPVVEMNEHAYQAINKLKQADRPLALADWGGVFMTAPHARRLEAMLEEQKTKLLGAGSEMLAELSKGYAPGGGMILVRSDIGANGVREEMAHWWFSQNIENDPSVARDMADALISSPVVQRAIRQLMLQGYPIKTMAETFLLNECLAKTLADPGGELMPLHPDDLRELLDQALNYLHREMTTVTFRRTLDALPDISPKARAIIDAWRQSNDDPGRQPLSTTEPEGRISDIQGNRESSGRPPPQGRDAGLLFTPQRDGAESRGRDEVARQRDLPDEGADEEMSPLENFMGAITDYIHSDQELTEGKLQRGIMRETRGQMDRRIAQTATALEKDRSRWARKSHDEFLKFADAVEKVGGAKVSDLDPKEQKLAQYFQDQYWKRIETIRALKEGALQDLIENYISHNWERPGLAKSTLKQVFSGRRPFAGRGSFLKQRTIPTIREGIELGLRPKTWNPVEDFLHKILDMDRFIMGHQTMMGMKQAGTAKMVRIGQRPPEGWQQLDDRIGTVQSKSDDGGLVLRGHYYAPADAAKPFNNFVSRGVAGKSQIYDTLRWANDNMNALQLGISFFHAMTTTNNAIAADVALGVQELSRGQVLSGTGRLARGVTLVPSVVQTFRNGSKLMKEYLSPGSYAKFAEEANALAVAGGRPKMDVLQPKPLQQIINHFRNGEVFRGGGKVLGSIIHATTAPVLDYWVPRMKVGAFYADAHSVLEYSRKRGWTPERTRAEIQKAWDSADHRFGQVVYDNLFWHKALRDMLQLTQRAVGWNYGTAAGVGGAIPESARAAGRVATGDVGEFGTLLGRAMSFVIGMTLATGLMGALLEYHWQKHGPRQAKDFFFPQRPDGQRVSIPGYMKDVFAFGHAPLQTVLNKLAPVFAAMAELYQNRDFYRVEIRHSDDNWLEQATEVGKYIGRTLEPFSARAQVKMLESQGAGVNNGAMGMLHAVLAHPEDAALGQLGFQPAAAYIQNTPAQNMAYEYSSENNPPGTRTREQFERSQIKQAIAAMHRTGHVDQAQIQKYVRAGQITPKDVREAAANAHTDPLVLTVRHGDLSLQQMLNVYLKANPGEKLKLKPMLARKAKSLQEIPNPETRRALGAELRKALGSATSEAVHADDSAWERPAMQY